MEDELFDQNQCRQRIGPNVVVEFVKSHDPIGMISELVQNDFDAKSRLLVVEFRLDGILTTSHGIQIDSLGWKRLSYLLGTSSDLAKRGGIGRKNFGLRSLFRIADRVVVSSAGYVLGISMEFGAREEPLKDPTAQDEGVSFTCRGRYRKEPLEDLGVFTINDEEELFDSIEENLTSFVQLLVCSDEQRLSNLQFGKAVRRPYEVRVTSDRLNRSVACRSTMWKDSQWNGLHHRRALLEAVRNETATPCETRCAEILFEIDDPPEFDRPEVPDYYLSRDGTKILAAISFPVNSKGTSPVITDVPGRLFYPIGMREEFTGLGMSLSAPFLLDMERDRILHSDDWNRHLLGEAGRRIGDVFRSVVLPRFGPKSYLLFVRNAAPTENVDFSENASLSMKRYVINELYEAGTGLREEHFCEVDNDGEVRAYLPADVADDDAMPLLGLYPVMVLLIGKSRTVSRQLAKVLLDLGHIERQTFIERFGIQPFTIQNVCEILVNDGKVKYNSTSPSGPWSCDSRDEFEQYCSDISYIRLYLDVLHRYWDLLDKDDVQAIKGSDWLQAADGSPRSFNSLSIWKGDMKTFIWPERDSILSPQLANHPIFSRRRAGGKSFKLQPFDVMGKLEDKAEKWDELSEDEKERIFRFIAKNWKHVIGQVRGKRLSPRCLTRMREIAKKHPILKDVGGNWVRLEYLRAVDENTRRAFGSSLHYPHPDLAKQFLSALKAPPKVRYPQDLVTRCEDLDQATIEEVLNLEDYLLSVRGFGRETKVALREHLRSVCTLDGKRRIARTSSAYIPSERLMKLLGKRSFPYLIIRSDRARNFFQRIGIREDPAFGDMVKRLVDLASGIGKLDDRKLFYAELAKAARRDNRTKEETSILPLVLIGRRLYTPEQVVLSRRLWKYFGKGIRYWPESRIDPDLRGSLRKLGCRDGVQRSHVAGYLNWVSQVHETDSQVGLRERDGIHRAYVELGSYSDGEIPVDAKVFLSRSNRLFSKRDIDAQLLCLDDMPELSKELIPDDHAIEFADYGNGRTFIDSTGIRTLLSLVDKMTVSMAKLLKDDRELTRKISSRHFKNALLSANRQVFRGALDEGKIRALGKAAICDSLSRQYSIRGIHKRLAVEVAVVEKDGSHILCLNGDHVELSKVAKELALYLATDNSARSMSIEFILILLQLETEKDTRTYLREIRNIDYIDYLGQQRRRGPRHVDEEPTDDEPTDYEKPTDDEPIDDEKPTDDEPIDDEPIDDEKPTDDEPIDDEPIDDDESFEDWKKKKGSTKGTTGTKDIKERPENVLRMQRRITREYQKCQLCGLSAFDGYASRKVYGHLRGHHLIPWENEPSVIDGLVCLCQPHHHMFHYAKEVVITVSRSSGRIEVSVNGRLEGTITTVEKHDVLDYLLDKAREIERNNPNTRVQFTD